MKILRITSLGYEGGGAENGIILMQPVLEARGVTVKIISSDSRLGLPHFSHYEFRALGAQPALLRLFYRLFYPQSFFAVRRILKKFRPDVVHVHTMSELSPSVLFALKKYPVVMTVHGAEDFTTGLLHWAFPPGFFRSDTFSLENLNWKGKLHYLYHRFFSSAVYRVALRRVDVVLSLSRFMQEELRRDGIESRYIPNATKLFAPAAVSAGGRELLFVGRLEKVKGVQVLFHALSEIIKTFPEATLTVAGEGGYRGALGALANSLGLRDRVHFVGHKNREQLYELYQHANVVIVPSIWPEAFGKVGIEAMSVGRPVIASDVGGISEWLRDGEVGYLVPPGDAAALADKITVLFSDPELLQKMSKRAAAHARNFSLEEHATSMLELYENVRKNYATG